MSDHRPRRARRPAHLPRPLVVGALVGALLGCLAGGGPAAPAVALPAPGDVVAQQDTGSGPQVPVNPELDPDETRRRADEILAGREYQAPEARDRTLTERIRRWLADRVPEWNGPSEGQNRGFSYTVLGVVGAIAVTALVLVLRGSRLQRRAPEADDAEVEVTPLRSPTEWGEEADRCERDGDHRGAVRARFRALTTTLARRDLVGDTPGRTAGELRADVAERAPGLTGPFDALASLFELVWFGRGHAGPAESERARELAATVLDVAPRRRGAAVETSDGADGAGRSDGSLGSDGSGRDVPPGVR